MRVFLFSAVLFCGVTGAELAPKPLSSPTLYKELNLNFSDFLTPTVIPSDSDGEVLRRSFFALWQLIKDPFAVSPSKTLERDNSSGAPLLDLTQIRDAETAIRALHARIGSNHAYHAFTTKHVKLWDYFNLMIAISNSSPSSKMLHTKKISDTFVPQSDEDYLATSKPHTEVPAWMNRKKFLDSVRAVLDAEGATASTELLNAVKAEIPTDLAYSVRYAKYPSLGGSAGEGEGRFLMALLKPESSTLKRDLYLQFNKSNASSTGTLVSSIAVVEADSTLHAYYYDQIVDNEEITQPKTVLMEDACLHCHASGSPIKVHYSSSLPDATKTELDAVNTRIQSYGMTLHPTHDRRDALLPAGMPTIGDGKVSSDLFEAVKARETSYSISSDKKTTLINRTNCGSCHDGSSRGELLVPLYGKPGTFVNPGRMPPNNDLTSEERRFLSLLIEQKVHDSSKVFLLPADLRD